MMRPRWLVDTLLAARTWDIDRPQTTEHLDAADASFTAARADRWIKRVQERRSRRN